MHDIAVAHLVRPAHGIGTFESFLDAYRSFEAGVDHELILIFKGFADDGRELSDYRKLIGEMPHHEIHYPDIQFDIGAYGAAARSFPFEFFCFLNSYGTPIDQGWLEKLYRHARREGVGVVGATASYESLLDCWSGDEGRSGRGLVGGIRSFIRLLPEGSRPRSVLERQWKKRLGAFKAFPNPHLRTNGFMMRRRHFLRMKVGDLVDKWDASEFESGKRSMTNQVFRMGLDVLVAGRDGEAYGIDRWFESRTFRSGDQSNLLIADNHTRDFDRFELEGRRSRSFAAWGDPPARLQTHAGDR